MFRSRVTLLSVVILSSLLALPVEAARSARGAPDELAFQQATEAREALKKDPKRRKLRESWLGVADRFDAMAKRYPKSRRADEALFAEAQVYETLARVSLAKRDLKAAIESYTKVTKLYPRSSLVDDAHLALGHIYRDRLGDSQKAVVELKAAVAVKGDRLREARRELVALQSALAGTDEKPSERRRAVAKSVPAPVVADDDEDDDDPTEDAPPARPPSRSSSTAKAREMAKAARSPEISLSTQMGLKIKRIVIDPGHGGYDPGAIGQDGLREKKVTLAIGKALKTRLEAAGFEVVMTRSTDVFMGLEKRTRFANREHGDLFISIHCNSAESEKLRGTETYTLNVASDRYAMRLAARENATSTRKISELQYLLADMATRANTDDSSRLARSVQGRMVELLGVKATRSKSGPGLKQALFYVLLGAKMPAILVETAFISNPRDEELLGDGAYQGKIAEAIAQGVLRFAAARRTVAGLD